MFPLKQHTLSALDDTGVSAQRQFIFSWTTRPLDSLTLVFHLAHMSTQLEVIYTLFCLATDDPPFDQFCSTTPELCELYIMPDMPGALAVVKIQSRSGPIVEYSLA